MKAIRITGYGGTEVMEFAEVEAPRPGPGDVLMEVHASSVNPLDWKIREGMMTDLFDLKLPYVMGRDLSGVVVEVGAAVDGISVGDELYGVGDVMRDSAQAEYVAIEPATLARKPVNISHVEAASLPIAGLSALAGLVTFGDLAAGEKVPIHAAAGGVGCIAVQIARHLGAMVAATASAANADYVRDLGADIVIDYRAQDFTEILSDYDLVFDVLGGDIHRRSYDVLRPGGRITYINADPVDANPPRNDIDARAAFVPYGVELFDEMTRLVENGAVRPCVEAVMPLAEAAHAYDLSQTGHQRGKIVLSVR